MWVFLVGKGEPQPPASQKAVVKGEEWKWSAWDGSISKVREGGREGERGRKSEKRRVEREERRSKNKRNSANHLHTHTHTHAHTPNR